MSVDPYRMMLKYCQPLPLRIAQICPLVIPPIRIGLNRRNQKATTEVRRVTKSTNETGRLNESITQDLLIEFRTVAEMT